MPVVYCTMKAQYMFFFNTFINKNILLRLLHLTSLPLRCANWALEVYTSSKEIKIYTNCKRNVDIISQIKEKLNDHHMGFHHYRTTSALTDKRTSGKQQPPIGQSRLRHMRTQTNADLYITNTFTNTNIRTKCRKW